MRVFVPFLIGFLLLFSSFAVAQPGSMTVQIQAADEGAVTTLEEQSFDHTIAILD